MTPNKIALLVTEGVELDREIQERTERLKEIKAALANEAVTREDELVVTEGGGSSWTATGSNGCVARVTFPAPTLKSKIDGEGKAIEKVRAAAGKLFDRLFRPAVTYRPIEKFRDEAVALLGKGAPKLIKLCESESSPKVAFETKELA